MFVFDIMFIFCANISAEIIVSIVESIYVGTL